MSYLLALDAGTGSVRAVIFDLQGNQIAVGQAEWKHLSVENVPGSMEFDLDTNWQLACRCIHQALTRANLGAADIQSVACCSMREGIVLYDRNGEAIWACANVDARASREVAEYYQAVVAAAGAANAKACANWVMGELAARLNKAELDIGASPVSAAQLAGLVARIADNTISNAIAKKVFEALWNKEGGDDANAADAIIDAQGLKQVTDSGAIEAIIDEVLAANQKSVDEFRAGKEKAFNALVGQAMKATKGKANPQQVNELLRKKLR